MRIWHGFVMIGLAVALAVFFASGGKIDFVTVAGGRAESEPAARRLAFQSLDRAEYHHVCVSGNSAQEALDTHILRGTDEQRRPLELRSSLSDHVCVVEEASVGKTLFTVAPRVADKCSARWRGQSLTCNVHVHAHRGHDCESLFSNWLIQDRCEISPIVLHDSPELVSCMKNKITQYEAKFPGAFDEKCKDLRWVAAGDALDSHMASALEATRLSVIERHSKVSDTGALGLRERAHLAYSSRTAAVMHLHDELLRVFAGLPADNRLNTLLRGRRLPGGDELGKKEPAIVVDNGSGMCKIGYAGHEMPRSTFPAVVGTKKHDIIIKGSDEDDLQVVVGEKAIAYRAMYKLTYPIEHGQVENEENWANMVLVWRYAFEESLGIEVANRNVMLTVAPMNSNENNIRMANIMFKDFAAGGVYIAIQAILSLYANARTTGVVLDSGDGVTHVVPVFEGFGLKRGITRLNLAGRDVTNQFILYLETEGTRFTTSSEKDIAKSMKQDLCFVSMNYAAEMAVEPPVTEEYRLPDNRVIKVGRARFMAPEILFTPSLIQHEDKGIVTMVYESVHACDIDVVATLFGSIVLSGGSTLYKNYPERLQADLEKMVHTGTVVKVIAKEDRYYSVWLGGATLAALGSFEKCYFTKKEWEDEGQSAKGIITKMM